MSRNCATTIVTATVTILRALQHAPETLTQNLPKDPSSIYVSLSKNNRRRNY